MSEAKELIVGEKQEIGAVVERDYQEERFKAFVELFLKGKLNYDELIELFPSYDSSMLRRISKSILRLAD